MDKTTNNRAPMVWLHLLLCALPVGVALLFLRQAIISGSVDMAELHANPLMMWACMILVFGVMLLFCAALYRLINRKSKSPMLDSQCLSAKSSMPIFVCGALTTITILCVFYLNMFFVGDITNCFGATPQTLLWHSFPWYVVSICFLTVCVAVFSLWKICSTSSNLNMARLFVFAIYALCGVTYLFYLFQQNLYADAWHQTAYVQSIYNVWYNTPYTELSTGIYGHYALFFKLPMLLLGQNIFSVVFTNALFGVLGLAAAFYVIHQHIHSNGMRVLAAMAMTAPVVSMRIKPYWQAQPLRIIFPALIMAYCTWIGTTKRSRLSWKSQLGGYALCSLAILWNTETGLICTLAFAAYSCVVLWQCEKCFCKKAFYTYLGQVCGVLGALVGALGIVNLYNLICGGPLILRAFFFPLFDTNYLGKVLYHPVLWGNYSWVHCLVLFLLCIVVTMVRSTALFGRHRTDNTLAVLTLSSVIGLGQFTYYVNRAAYQNLDIVLIQAIFCIAYLADKGFAILSNQQRRTLRDGVLAAVGGSLAVLMLALSLTFVQMPISLEQRINGRKSSAYSLEEIANLATSVESIVPKDTYAFGLYTVGLYSYLGWDPGYHLRDVTDFIDPENVNLILDEVFSQPTLLVSQDQFTRMDSHPEYHCAQTFWLSDDENIYAYYVKTN
ncbi:MAG: hypothetical protein RSC58_05530 [Ruthenibacterium sp.]